MTAASRSLATALPMGALHERLALPSYTTTGDTTRPANDHSFACASCGSPEPTRSKAPDRQ